MLSFGCTSKLWLNFIEDPSDQQLVLKIQQNVHVAAYEIVTTDVPILTRKGLNIFMRLREKIG